MLDGVKQYEMPFESEVGLHPSLEDMQDVVVTRRLRPPFSADWIQDDVSSSSSSSSSSSCSSSHWKTCRTSLLHVTTSTILGRLDTGRCK